MTHWNDPGADPLADLQKITDWILEQKGVQSMWFLAYLELLGYGGYVISIDIKPPYQISGPSQAIFRIKEPI